MNSPAALLTGHEPKRAGARASAPAWHAGKSTMPQQGRVSEAGEHAGPGSWGGRGRLPIHNLKTLAPILALALAGAAAAAKEYQVSILGDDAHEGSKTRMLKSIFFPAAAALAVQPDDRVLVGGMFERVNGVDCAHLARFNVDGSLDATFQSRFDRARFRNTRLTMAANRAPPSSAGALASAGTTTPANSDPTAALTASSADSRADSAGTILIKRLEIQGPNVELKFIGSPGRTFVWEARAAWDQGKWSAVSTNVTDAGGLGSFTDVGAARRPMRFYRLRAPGS